MPNSKKTTKEKQESRNAQDSESQQESVWEWVVAAIGALIVASTLGFLVYDSFRTTSPPNVLLEMTDVQMLGERYLVQFQANNKGGQGAAAVNIEGTLRGADGEVETANTTIDYIAGGSTQAGGLYFSQDPRAGELELKVLGYEEP